MSYQTNGSSDSRVTEEDVLDKDYLEYMRTVIKGRMDPVWLVESEFDINLYPKQAELMHDFYAGKKKHLTLACGMRSGKSVLAATIAAYEYWYMLTLPQPQVYYGLLKNQPLFISVVSTSEKQALDSIFTNAANHIEESDFFQTWTDARVKGTEITSKSKNITMRALSSWATTAVGRSNKCVVFDELANFEDTNGKRGAWEIYSRLSKSTDTFKNDGHIVSISSPKTPNDIIMTLYKRQREERNAIALCLPTWEMNPNFTKEELMEEHKFNLPMFWRDFGVQPHAFSTVQFPEGVKLNKRLTNRFFSDYTYDTNQRVMAIDPAVTSDAFGIAAGYKTMDGRVIIDAVKRFQKTEGETYISPTDIRNFIDKYIPKLNVNEFIFDAWMYPELIEHVDEKFGIPATKHIVRKEDYDRWREFQSNDMIDVVHDDHLENEANNLIVIDSGSKPKIDHPFGGSKDMADCVANCLWFLSENDIGIQPADIVVCTAF